MPRLIGIDLSCSPARGAIIDLGETLPLKGAIDGSLTSQATRPLAVANFLLTPENIDDTVRAQLLTADGSVAVMSPAGGFGLGVTLPFGDRKRVAALLPQELEDILPFPPSDFAFGYSDSSTKSASSRAASAANSDSSSGKSEGAAQHHFQVQFVPKGFVREALSGLASIGIDPTVLTPRSSTIVPIAAALVRHNLIRPEDEVSGPRSRSFFVVVPRSADEADVLFIVDGAAVHHQTVHAAITGAFFKEAGSEGTVVDSGEQRERSLSSAVMLELGNVDRRFKRYLRLGFVVPPLRDENLQETEDEIGDLAALNGRELEDGLQLEIALVDLRDLFPQLQLSRSNQEAVLAALCSPAYSSLNSVEFGNVGERRGQGTEPVNFRRGEFSYRPALGEAIRVGRKLLRPIALTVACAAVCGLGFFLFRAQEISRLERRLANAVALVAPQLSAESGKELTALAEEAGKMEQELKDIGTSDNSSPLELYAELTRHFPQLPDTTVDRVSIRGNRIEVRGCAPSYRVIEQIENALTKVKRFDKVKKGSSQGCAAGGNGARGFTFEVTSRD